MSARSVQLHRLVVSVASVPAQIGHHLARTVHVGVVLRVLEAERQLASVASVLLGMAGALRDLHVRIVVLVAIVVVTIGAAEIANLASVRSGSSVVSRISNLTVSTCFVQRSLIL